MVARLSAGVDNSTKPAHSVCQGPCRLNCKFLLRIRTSCYPSWSLLVFARRDSRNLVLMFVLDYPCMREDWLDPWLEEGGLDRVPSPVTSKRNTLALRCSLWR